MAKKIISWVVLSVLILIFIVSSSSSWMKKITEQRWKSNNKIWRSDGFRYGDLFYMSFLSNYKIDKSWNPKRVKKDSSFIDLYIIGDSYLKYITDKNIFAGVDNLMFVDWRYEPMEISLRKNKKNILIFETTERHFRERFHDTSNFKFQFVAKNKRPASLYSFNEIIRIVNQFLFNKNINQNLEFNLFDYPIFTKIKSIKADFNESVFSRHSPEVSMADDKSILFLSFCILC